MTENSEKKGSDEPEIIREDNDLTTDTNAGEDAISGTVAEADVKEGDQPKAPERDA
jgi:3-deoxy-D-arabino-heptulosonate 7-phosphate (DAHP) synthase